MFFNSLPDKQKNENATFQQNYFFIKTCLSILNLIQIESEDLQGKYFFDTVVKNVNVLPTM